MVNIIKLTSRIVHQLTVGIIIGSSFVAYLSDSFDFSTKNSKMLLHGCGTLALLSGLYNAHAAQPKKMGSYAKIYRMIVYGIKIPMWILLLTAEHVPINIEANKLRVGLVCGLVCVSSFVKFFREDHQAPDSKFSS